ncbi:8964_t:CDS:2, partial [Gigaspora margarita]
HYLDSKEEREKSKFLIGSMKSFIDPHFITTASELWDLCSFAKLLNESAFSRELCLYLYKEGLQNIIKSTDFDYEQKAKAKAFLDIYEVQEKQNSTFLEALENKSNSCSAKSTIFQDRHALLVDIAKSSNATLNTSFTQADVLVSGSKTPEQQIMNRSTGYDTSPEQSPEYIPRLIFNQVDSNPSIAGNKHYIDSDEEDDTEEEYNANQTIIGGQVASWIVNGLDIRKKFTEYQLKTKLTKTKSEYYDVIFFNAIDDNSFLETLEEDTVALMNKDIREEEKKMPNNIEETIKSLFNEIISRDINTTKEKLKQKECNDSFEINFALYFVNHIIEMMEDTNLLLEPISEGTYIVSILASILNKFFIKNKKSWRAQYGDTCLKANARDCNAQKEDDKHRSPGRKIDVIITLTEEDEEFSIVEVSGPPSKQDWTHFKGDRMKITKMLKTSMNSIEALLSFKCSDEYSHYFVRSGVCSVCNKDHKDDDVEDQWNIIVKKKTYWVYCCN